jgi:hypothetical protein
MVAHGMGDLGETEIARNEVDRLIAIGADGMMRAVARARHGVLEPYLHSHRKAIREHQLADAVQRSNKATRSAPARHVIRRSLQLGVFRLGLLEDRDIGVGVLPEGEEILVGSLCLGLISRQSERSA